jgi:hypothetical protein
LARLSDFSFLKLFSGTNCENGFELPQWFGHFESFELFEQLNLPNVSRLSDFSSLKRLEYCSYLSLLNHPSGLNLVNILVPFKSFILSGHLELFQ